MSLPSLIHTTRWYGLLVVAYIKAFRPKGDAFACGMAAICFMNILFVHAVVFFLITPKILLYAAASPLLPLMTTAVMALKIVALIATVFYIWRIFLSGPPISTWPELLAYVRYSTYIQDPHLLPSSQFDKVFREAARDPAQQFLMPRFFSTTFPPGSTITSKDLAPLLASPDRSIRFQAIQFSSRLADCLS